MGGPAKSLRTKRTKNWKRFKGKGKVVEVDLPQKKFISPGEL